MTERHSTTNTTWFLTLICALVSQCLNKFLSYPLQPCPHLKLDCPKLPKFRFAAFLFWLDCLFSEAWIDQGFISQEHSLSFQMQTFMASVLAPAPCTNREFWLQSTCSQELASLPPSDVLFKIIQKISSVPSTQVSLGSDYSHPSYINSTYSRS